MAPTNPPGGRRWSRLAERSWGPGLPGSAADGQVFDCA
jgi:hypothetical protein